MNITIFNVDILLYLFANDEVLAHFSHTPKKKEKKKKKERVVAQWTTIMMRSCFFNMYSGILISVHGA